MKIDKIKSLKFIIGFITLFIAAFLIVHSFKLTKKIKNEFKQNVSLLEEIKELLLRKQFYEKRKIELKKILAKKQKIIMFIDDNEFARNEGFKSVYKILEQNTSIIVLSKEILPINDMGNDFFEVKFKFDLKCSIDNFVWLLYHILSDTNKINIDEIIINNSGEGNMSYKLYLSLVVTSNPGIASGKDDNK